MSKKWFRPAAYYATGLLQGINIILIPASSFIFKDPALHDISDRQYGMVFLPMVCASVLVTLHYRRFMVFLGRKKLFLSGFIGNVLFLALLVAASRIHGDAETTFLALAAANTCLGVGFGFTLPTLNIFTAEIFGRHRIAAVAALHGIFGIGASLAPLGVERFYHFGDWTLGVLVTLGAWFFMALAIFGFGRVPAPLQAVRNQNAPESAKDKTRLFGGGLMLMTLVYGVSESIVGNWTTVYLTVERGFSVKTASVALSLFWMSLTAGRLLSTVLSMKIDPRYLLRASPCVMVTGLAMILGLSQESQILPAYVLAGLGCSYFFPLGVAIGTDYLGHAREHVTGRMFMGIMIGVGIGSSAIGFLTQSDIIELRQAFWIAFAAAVLLIFLSFFLTRRKLPIFGHTPDTRKK